ncbi:MAG: class I SAM-dependent methyltransferase [Candidatus Obscuribacterales bacterium]|nr:class I SAM-dependent methyltransferase [Candidatus Obscuribacterales bacterium]
MGIDNIQAEMILHEHAYKPLQGRVLTVGRQTVSVMPEQLAALLKAYKLPQRSELFEIDRTTVHTHMHHEQMTDASFFLSFADCTVQAVDISDYEGAEIVHDIGQPVPDSLKNQFDFIYDGSTLDNVFNPAQSIANLSSMLRPGGRLLLHNWCSGHSAAYVLLSPDWYMDFFSLNNYADCKVYVVEYLASPRVWHYDPLVVYSGQQGYECSSNESASWCAVICLAEKGEQSSSHINAVQKHYRNGKIEPYLSNAIKYHNSPRPIFHSRTVLAPKETKSISTFNTLRLVCDWAAPAATLASSR